MHMTFFRIHDQFGFVGRNDDGVESLPDPGGGATFIAPINTNFSQLVDVNFRLRILLTMGASGTSTRAMRMRRNLNGGGYVTVGAGSSVVRTSLTAFYTNRSNATEGIIGPLRVGYETWADLTNNHRVEDLIETGNCNYPSNNSYMSAEYCMRIIGDDVNDGDTIQFRIQRNTGQNLSNYFVTPQITVIKPDLTTGDKRGRMILEPSSRIQIEPSSRLDLDQVESHLALDQTDSGLKLEASSRLELERVASGLLLGTEDSKLELEASSRIDLDQADSHLVLDNVDSKLKLDKSGRLIIDC